VKFAKSIVFFLIINFGGLAIGSWLMGIGPTGVWYLNLDKAPWTPPGWVFGAAWTTIMVCFSIYLVYLFKEKDSLLLRFGYAALVLLNVIWNYIFFNQHQIALGLFVITLLTVLVLYFFWKYKSNDLKRTRFLLLPYMIWMVIATSLNAYILLNN